MGAGNEKTESQKEIPLYAPQTNYECLRISGRISSIEFNQVKSSTSFAQMFSVHHCFLIFTFSSNVKIRCEISNYKEGAAPILFVLKQNEKVNYCKSQLFHPKIDQWTINKVIDLAEQYFERQRNQKYHVENNNCYDFAAYMLNDIVSPYAAQDVLRWKKHEMERVPEYLKKKT